MVTSCGVAALALRTLRDAGIEVVLITTSDLDISLLVRGENEDSALNVLRQAFAA
ncbi:MAG: ACT domain-containing protein [Ruthenibacterium lactatiformans]